MENMQDQMEQYIKELGLIINKMEQVMLLIVIIHIGNFINGLKNGKGKFFFPEGNSYEGNFINNEIKGEGVYKWRDGRIYIGYWEGNKMNGYGIFMWPDCKKYYGHYVDNNKDGLTWLWTYIISQNKRIWRMV